MRAIVMRERIGPDTSSPGVAGFARNGLVAGFDRHPPTKRAERVTMFREFQPTPVVTSP